MYKDKRFRIRATKDIIEDIAGAGQGHERVFLADGDALIIKTDELKKILAAIKQHIPQCRRVGIYGTPYSMMQKSAGELKELKQLGLGIVYTGLESGCDTLLKKVNKGHSADEIIKACKNVKDAGIALSVTAVLGLAGKQGWESHAVGTGRALSAIKPEYIGLLTLMLEKNTELYKEYREGKFQYPSEQEIARETLVMLQNMDCEGSVFRCNHASNYLPLKGTLNADKKMLCEVLEHAIEGKMDFRPERYRLL